MSRGRAKTSLLENEALSRFFEPLHKDPTVESEIQRHLDLLDEVAREMEAVWGVGRLIPLVDDVLRGKFFKNMAALNKAVEAGKVDEVEKQATSLARGWRAMDAAARGVGHKPKPHDGFEIRLQDGRVVAIVPDGEVPQYRKDGTEVLTLSEASLAAILSDLLGGESALAKTFKTFPAASLAPLARKSPPPDWQRGDDIPF